MVNPLEIFGKKEQNDSDFFIYNWHFLMKYYSSWIPFEEYSNLSQQVVDELILIINKELKERSKKKGKR